MTAFLKYIRKYFNIILVGSMIQLKQVIGHLRFGHLPIESPLYITHNPRYYYIQGLYRVVQKSLGTQRLTCYL